MEIRKEPTLGATSAPKILLVDDMAAWRDKLRSLLKGRPEWNVIAEASDGQEAIEKASEMQPDIILLDVEMPSVNGIEAGKSSIRDARDQESCLSPKTATSTSGVKQCG